MFEGIEEPYWGLDKSDYMSITFLIFKEEKNGKILQEQSCQKLRPYLEWKWWILWGNF